MNCSSWAFLSGLGTIKILGKTFSYNFKNFVENRLEKIEIIFARKSMVAKDFKKQKWRAENLKNFQIQSMARQDLLPL